MANTYRYIIDFIANTTKFTSQVQQAGSVLARQGSTYATVNAQLAKYRGMLENVRMSDVQRINVINQKITALEREKGAFERLFNSEKKGVGVNQSFMGSIQGIGAAVGVAFSVGAVVNFMKSSVEAYNVSAQAETALLVALKGREDVQKRLIRQASELMGKTLFDDDDTVRAQSMIAAFVKEESTIKRLIPVIMDFATAKQMDLVSASELVTKSVAGEVNALGRYGISLDAAAGTAERTEEIITKLNDAFGGQAEAAAKVGSGAIIQLTNQWENLKEVVGSIVIKDITNDTGAVKIAISGLTDVFQRYRESMEWKDFEPGWVKWTNAILPGTAKMVRMLGFGKEEYEAAKADIQKKSEELAKLPLNELQKRLATEQVKLDFFKSTASEDYIKERQEAITVLTARIKELGGAAGGSQPALTELQQLQQKSVTTYGDVKERLSEYAALLDRTALSNISQKVAIEQTITALEKQKAAFEAVGKVMANRPDLPQMAKMVPMGKPTNVGTVAPVDTSQLADMSSWFSNNKVSQTAAKEAEQLEILQQKMLETEEIARSVGQAIGGAFDQMGAQIVDSLGLAETGMQGFVGGMIQTVVKLLGMLLANAIGNAIAGASNSALFTGPGAVFTLPVFIGTAVASVMSAFAKIPAFAAGGLAYGPTIGMVGEYPGAASNPEVISPLSKLKAIIEKSIANVIATPAAAQKFVAGAAMGMVGKYPGAASNREVVNPLAQLKATINNGVTVILQGSLEMDNRTLRVRLAETDYRVGRVR